MKKTTKAIYGAVAGLALLTASGGGTYASWRDQAPIASNNVQTGNLNLNFTQELYQTYTLYERVLWTLYDAQGNQVGEPSRYWAAQRKEVKPGYKLVGVTDVTVTLEGGTIQAHLIDKDVEFSTQLINYGADVAAWLTKAIETTEITVRRTNTGQTPVYINNQKDGQGAVIRTLLTNTNDYTVTVTVQFPKDELPKNTTNLQSALMILGSLDLELVQVVHPNAFTE